MGIEKIFSPGIRLFKKGIKQTKRSFGNLSRSITGGNTDTAPVQESESDRLAREEKDKLENIRRARSSLTQTSTLGSGDPKTSRATVLGVGS